MKKYIILAVVGLVVSVSFVFAESQPDGQPFQAIWDAIRELKDQITNIQLIPGPKGDSGPQGSQGLQGASGTTIFTVYGSTTCPTGELLYSGHVVGFARVTQYPGIEVIKPESGSCYQNVPPRKDVDFGNGGILHTEILFGDVANCAVCKTN